MKRLAAGHDGLYQAGLPHFPRNFTRDSIISALLLRDAEMLANQLSFCAAQQGRSPNQYNGEEPGKIFHEYPGVEINGLSTEFNACDTTALYVIGHEVYQQLSGDTGLASKQRENIDGAVAYILSHLKDGLFIEDPRYAGADDFALKVTYWKDSELPGRKEGKPKYPVCYTLAHVQNMRALRSAARLLSSKRLETIAKTMSEALQRLYDRERGAYYIGIDAEGPIRGVSSDSLHALFYLDQDDLPKEVREGIVASSETLETPVGYRTLSAQLAEEMNDQYHGLTVWPFEQALIHIGARKFGLKRVEEVSERVTKYLDTDPELFVIGDGITKAGCDPQLWTIAAKEYFKAPLSEHFL